MARKLGFFSLKDRYTADFTDAPSAIVTVWRGSRVKKVDDYGETGPAESWAMATLIDAVVKNARDWQPWDPKKR